MKKRKPRRRDYTIEDLAAIAEQLGCCIQFQLIPVEAVDRIGVDGGQIEVAPNGSPK